MNPVEPPPSVRLSDVAREAGVSLATADRVLNGRPGVRGGTALRVRAAAERLAYRPDPAAARLARTASRPWRIAFVLPQGDNRFVAQIRDEIAALGPWLAGQRAQARVTSADAFSPAAAAQAVADLRGHCDAAVVMLQDHPRVRAAIDELTASGVCVLALVSDVPTPGRRHFVGIDNVAAGRTAGTLLARFTRSDGGRVGIVMGSKALRDHADRLFGFQQAMAEEGPRLELLPPLEGQDDPARTAALVRSLLQREPRLAGLYSIGAGNTGIETALREADAAGRVVWVCHELTPDTRRALLDGTVAAVIHQNAAHEVRSACRVALSLLSREPLLADQERIRIEIYLKDNLP